MDSRRTGQPHYFRTLPPLAVHSASPFASLQPCPLQAFNPLQEEELVMQELWPLQALRPPHFTVPWALTVETMAPAANTAAAARKACLPMAHSRLRSLVL